MGDMTSHRASDEQRQQPSPPLVLTELERRLAVIQSELQTVQPKQAMAELAACLTLVAPSGMSADDRTEWLKVARVTIGDVSQGALQAACAECRKRIRRVSDIVPTIVEEAETAAGRLYRQRDNIRWQIANPPRPMIEAPRAEDAQPFTVDELLKMTPDLRRIARRNGFASDETFAEVDRIMGERQDEVGGTS